MYSENWDMELFDRYNGEGYSEDEFIADMYDDLACQMERSVYG